ncbi:MAG: VWA domain-containing protein [Vicinamibacterales bacterium]
MTVTALHLLHPWVLWLLPLALLPFLLHRRSEDAARRVVSALHLWPAAPPPVQRAARVHPFVVTRRSGVLAALIAVILIALAGPVWRARTADVVLIVDASASMGARLGAGTRLDRGRNEALAAVQREAGPLVRLIAAGAQPSDRGRFAADDGLRDAFAAIAPGATSGHLRQALALAAALEPGVPVWIVSDHAVTGVARSIVATGSAGNVAITALTAEAAPGGGVDVTARIENSAATPARGTLAILASGRAIAESPVVLDAGSAITWRQPLAIATAAVDARLTPDTPDALAVDNTRSAVVTPAVSARVRIDDAADTAVAQAVAANPAFAVTPGAEADVEICRRCPDATSAGVLQLAGPAARNAVRASVALAGPAHPVTAGLSGLEATAAVAGPASTTTGIVLVRAGGAPVVTVDEHPRGRTVILHAADDPAFTGTAFFAVLVANAIEWLAGGDNPRTLDAGEPLHWWTGGAAAATLLGPDGRERPTRLEGGRLSSADIASPGIYLVQTPGRSTPLAVTTPAAESTLDAPADALPPVSGTPGAPPVRPLAPWLLAAALALVLVEWRAWPRIDGALPPRALCAAALAAAAAGLQLPAGRQALSVVFAVDRSDSIAPRDQVAAMAAAARASRDATDGDASGLVTFAGRPIVRRAPTTTPLTADAGLDAGTALASGDTAIADAIRAALPLVPHDGSGRIVLATDGWETDGRATDAAAEAAVAQVPIDVLPLTARSSLPFVRAVYAPGEVRAGEPFSVRVSVGGPTGRTAAVTLDGGDEPVTAAVPIGPDGTGTAQVTVRRRSAGLAVLRARTGDEPDPSAPAAAVTVLGPPRLLHLTPAEDAGRRVPLPLTGYRIDRVGAALAPVAAAALAPYQLVVLDGVAGGALPAAAATALADWVGDGGGLVVLGSPDSLPPGGYAQRAVDALLPADLRVAPSSRTPAVATVVAIDTSGSMADTVGGLQKIEAARDAVRRVSRALAPGDPFGVVAFDVRARAVAEPGRAAPGPALEAALAALTPGGATRLAPAVEMAATWFGDGATRRHLLVVSDGRTSADDLARAGALAAAGGLTLSVIAIGADADRAGLTALASRAGGRVYFPATLAELPRLAAADVVASRGGATVTTPVALRAAGSHPVLDGLALDRLPEIGGYVVTAPRAGAEAILDSALSDPVLIAGRAGLGRVVLVTTDLSSTWTAGLRAWPGYPALMAQTLGWASRRDSGAGVDAALEETPTGTTLRVWFEQGLPDGSGGPAPAARVRTPDDRLIDLRLQPAGARLFTADLPVDAPGLYRVDVTAGDDVRLTRGLVRHADRERAAAGTNEVLLDELARMTGGRTLTAGGNPFDVPRPLAFVPVHPVPELLALAAVIALASGRRLARRPARPSATGAAA